VHVLRGWAAADQRHAPAAAAVNSTVIIGLPSLRTLVTRQ
jgi:hypothetical protein